MKLTNKITTIALASALGLAGAVHGQTTIASFDMSDNEPTATIGGSIASFSFSGTPNYATVAATTGFTNALNQAGGWGTGSYWELTLDTTGFTDVTISEWGQRSSNTGPQDFRLDVSYDSGDNFFTLVADYTVPNSNAGYSNPSIILSSLADDNDGVILRWINFSNTGVNGNPINTDAGTSRFTDFSVTAVPEPGAYALLAGLLGLGFVLTRRRRA